MANNTKPTPIKHCEWCGKSFNRKRVGKNNQLECYSNYMRRRFCSLSCSTLKQRSISPPNAAASRKRAMKNNTGICEACGSKTETVVHHVDGNPMNNDLDNLQTLCSACHSFWHNVLRRLKRNPMKPMPRLVG